MSTLSVLILFSALLVSTTSSTVQQTKPNIVYVLVDDWGFADVGFKNPAVKTPNFDELATTGLILNRHYVFKKCSPSRASLLSGRWPHHVHQWNAFPNVAAGLNLKITALPAKLKQAGYATHMVGKWHQGFFDPAYLPVNRGFDSFSGFLGGGEGHLDQKRDCAVDFWKNEDVDKRNGTYDSYIYRDDLTDIFNSLNHTQPLFLYLALHNIHSPIEAPQEWLDLYPEDSMCSERRTIQAMVSVADNVTGHLVELLKNNSMWENTIMVVSSDNGGAPEESSNFPLRGTKGTFFEGGVRSIAFANGGLLPKDMNGKSSEGFIHIADWYPTFCKLAGVDPSDSGEGKFPLDGLDVWPIITGENTTTPHKEIVLGYNYDEIGALISGEYKLVVGSQGRSERLIWTTRESPCKTGRTGENCDPYCLYNIVKDPNEEKELSKTEPEILKKMLDTYNEYDKEPRELQDQGYHGTKELPVFKDACKYMRKRGGYWRPWINAN